MNQIISITANSQGDQMVSARDLHGFLESKQDFSNWIRGRIEKYGFIEGEDFSIILSKSTGGRPTIEYALTIDVAKELAMVEGNENGRQARRYFIKCEKQLKQNAKAFSLPADYESALLALLARVQSEKVLLLENEELRLRQQRQQPKVDFYDAVTESTDVCDIGTVANLLNVPGVGRTKLFAELRQRQVLMSNNRPYQRYIDKGWFRVIETKWTKPDGSQHINFKTVVFQRGIDGIRRLLLNAPAVNNENHYIEEA